MHIGRNVMQEVQDIQFNIRIFVKIHNIKTDTDAEYKLKRKGGKGHHSPYTNYNWILTILPFIMYSP